MHIPLGEENKPTKPPLPEDTNNNDMDAMEKARKRVKEQKEFYGHLASYVICGVFFIALNLITSPSHPWFMYFMLGWGIGLATHYFKVFGVPGSGLGSHDWEEKAIEREMRRLGGGGKNEQEDYLDLKELSREGKASSSKKAWDDQDLV